MSITVLPGQDFPWLVKHQSESIWVKSVGICMIGVKRWTSTRKVEDDLLVSTDEAKDSDFNENWRMDISVMT